MQSTVEDRNRVWKVGAELSPGALLLSMTYSFWRDIVSRDLPFVLEVSVGDIPSGHGVKAERQ